MNFSHLKSFQKKVVPKVVHELEVFFDEELAKAGKKDQVLVEAVNVLKEFTLRGGKRVGPMMVILGYQLAKEITGEQKEEAIFRAAAAAETHHLYLLNIDDMADRDVLRHGGKTLEEYYRSEVFQDWPDRDHHGRTFSSIIGALLGSYAFELLSTAEFDAQRILAANRVVTDMLFSDTIVGWQIQYYQNNEPVERASEEQFMKGLEFVTSRYKFVGPMLMGLNLALSSTHAEFDKLSIIFTQYGKHVGIAFQIYDDILGVFGDSKETGKAVGNDIREGKKTLLIQKAFRNGNAQQKKIIKAALNRPLTEQDLAEVQQVMEETGALAYSQELAAKHVAQAIAILAELPQCEAVEVLKELAEYMIKRDK